MKIVKLDLNLMKIIFVCLFVMFKTVNPVCLPIFVLNVKKIISLHKIIAHQFAIKKIVNNVIHQISAQNV